MFLKKLLYLVVPVVVVFSYNAYAQAGGDMKTVDDMIRKGKFNDAAVVIDKIVAAGTIMPPDLIYEYARVYAEAGNKEKSAKLLDEAVDKGFWSINRLKEDKGLSNSLGQAEVNKVLDRIRTVTAPYSNGKAILSKKKKQAVIELAQRGLKNLYFEPKIATEMSNELSKMFNDGYFDGKDTLSVFTGELVKYFRKKTNDKHFYIGIDRGILTERVPNLNLTTPEERNFGFRDVAVRNGNIGYIKWDECIAGPEAYKTAQSALTLLRNTRAVVIDISANGGGNGEISTFLYHYLFKPDDKRFETLLIKKCKGEAEWHRSEPPVAPLAGGPDLGDKPIYIVTSGNTFSAAEYFAFMMKELKRATIIGKNTGGGGNPINTVGDGRFIMYVPTCQITTSEGKSLEGKGVAPDIEFTTHDWAKELMEVVNADLKSKNK